MKNQDSYEFRRNTKPIVKRNFIPTEKDDVGINVRINERLAGLLRQNNRLSAEEFANALGISPRQCERIIADLKAQGIIERKGAKKSGYWELLK